MGETYTQCAGEPPTCGGSEFPDRVMLGRPDRVGRCDGERLRSGPRRAVMVVRAPRLNLDIARDAQSAATIAIRTPFAERLPNL